MAACSIRLSEAGLAFWTPKRVTLGAGSSIAIALEADQLVPRQAVTSQVQSCGTKTQ